VSAIYDKGADKGALLCQERRVVDAGTGELLATVSQVSMLRGDGGRGGSEGAPPAPHQLPDRQPDAVCDLPTLPQAALIYRLSGDTNPLHADPAVAHSTGFERPILHGLCAMGVACHAVLRTLLAYDAARLRAMCVRFSAPVLPGDTLRTEIWQDGDVISFRTFAREREVMVLNAGRIDLRPFND
jgi:acyl dehydratase